jgi:4-alpha-glucanotransferase
MIERASGVLLHPTSLPGRGTGDLGEAAYRFVDWLAGAGQSYWQLLPLVAVTEGGSPYNGLSALAGNPLLISPERLVRGGLLNEADLETVPVSSKPIDFPRLAEWKGSLLAEAHRAFRDGAAPELTTPFDSFRRENASWLDDYALFRALREHHRGAPWTAWEPRLQARERNALREAEQELADVIGQYAFQQFLFDRQWSALRRYANDRGIRIIGDIPIFVAHDSADVWAHRELFQLDEEGEPEVVSGVPPDYFSETGQRWGNPLYRWDAMAERGYAWWTERFRRTLEWVDVVRVDHFRGFEAYWEIPASEETALNGRWVPGPGEALFRAVERELGSLPVIAEDLGLITPEVEELRDTLGFPGMRVLQFAFDGDPSNPHLPGNHPENAVSYTGTHDNDTAVGWWEHASAEEREQFRRLAGGEIGEIHWQMIRLAFASEARLAVAPLQDVLGLGSEARMNTPGASQGSWEWRCAGEAIDSRAQARLRRVTGGSDRLSPSAPDPDKHQTAGMIR